MEAAGDGLRGGGREDADDSGEDSLLPRRLYYPRVFAFIWAQVEDIERAKELAAGVFVRLKEERPLTLDPIALFSLARQAVERERRRHFASAEPVRLRVAVSAREEAVREPRMARLLDCLTALPRRDREILSLRFDGGLSCREIAKVMSADESDVRAGVVRALRQLRECFPAGGEDSRASG